MTTIRRRESAPCQVDVERLVVGPTLFNGVADPSVGLQPRACVLYVFPERGAATIGSALCPDDVCRVVADGVSRRRPDAVWLRDLPWFVDSWGVRRTGRLQRGLSDIVSETGLEFVAWQNGGLDGPTGRGVVERP